MIHNISLANEGWATFYIFPHAAEQMNRWGTVGKFNSQYITLRDREREGERERERERESER
jgi:hypothetical protein